MREIMIGPIDTNAERDHDQEIVKENANDVIAKRGTKNVSTVKRRKRKTAIAAVGIKKSSAQNARRMRKMEAAVAHLAVSILRTAPSRLDDCLLVSCLCLPAHLNVRC